MVRLIDADALIHEIDECGQEGTIANYVRGVLKATLSSIPTVDAEPVRHAHWTTHRTVEHDGEWYCSGCGYEPTVFENAPYCSRCGAKMDGGETNGSLGKEKSGDNKLQHRVEFLEEKLCPGAVHDWVQIDTDYEDFGTGQVEAVYIYQCRRCGRRRISSI